MTYPISHIVKRPFFGVLTASLLATAGLAAELSVAHAASSEWIETEGGRVRITALSPTAEGTIRAILDVDLLPGWKTYWRDPGDAGIPPSISFEGSENVAHSHLDFPAPVRVDDGYSVWAGYKYPVAFPVTLKQSSPGQKSVIEAQVFLGICESICIPVQANISLVIDPAKPHNDFELRTVEKAYELIPESPGNDFSITEVNAGANAETISVTFNHPASKSDVDLFVTGPMGWYFDIPSRVTGGDTTSTFHIPVLEKPENVDLSGSQLNVLATASDRSMETSISLP